LDLDWLADREEETSNPHFHRLLWTLFQSPEDTAKEFSHLSPEMWKECQESFDRCRRFQNKHHIYIQEAMELDKRMADEEEQLCKYWARFTPEQLEIFKQDERFASAHRYYLEFMQEREEKRLEQGKRKYEDEEASSINYMEWPRKYTAIDLE
jgi:hypothetical protein